MIRQISADEILVEIPTVTVVAQSECPHRKGKLRYGHLNTRRATITCPLHHSTFDLHTGEQVSGPPCGPIHVTVIE